MGEMIILGCASAVPDIVHDNTHLFLASGSRKILIDCGSTPIQRLQHLRVGCEDLTDLILTHFHPDHVAAAPLLLMGLWLMGRTKPLEIYGNPHTLERLISVMELYDWENWQGFYPVNFHRIPEQSMEVVIDQPGLRVFGSPVKHLIPTLGFRFELQDPHRVIAYSCDTEPCPQVVQLAQGCDVLIHEAVGESKGHTSAAQAGVIARQAGAKALCLIHYPTWVNSKQMVEEARREFGGLVYAAKDGMKLDLK